MYLSATSLTHSRRRGTVAVFIALSLTVLVGILAITLDGGLMLTESRHAQVVADAAATAAAADLFQNAGLNAGTDPSGTAKASALDTAKANGYSNDGITSVVTVNIPPLSGDYVGKAGFAEVIVQYNLKRGFSAIWGNGTLPVTARAVASGIPGSIGILILDPALSDSCEIDGKNVNILNGGQIYVNSTDGAGTQVASGVKLSCGGLNLVGGLANNGSITYTNGGGLKTGVAPVADPLAKIPEPTTAGLTTYPDQNITSNTTLQPGIYKNITIKSGAVTLAPGIYYLSSGGRLQLNGGSLSGTGVMFFDDTGGDSILNQAKGPVDITPPTSGPYQGISFWIVRSQTKEVHIESTFNLNMPGTWYAQGGEFDIRPLAASTVFNIGNYICDQAEWGQGGSIGTININPGSAAPSQRPMLVE